MIKELKEKVTHFSPQLSDEDSKKEVTVGGKLVFVNDISSLFSVDVAHCIIDDGLGEIHLYIPKQEAYHLEEGEVYLFTGFLFNSPTEKKTKFVYAYEVSPLHKKEEVL